MMPMIQAIALSHGSRVGPPSVSARAALITTDTGWFSAHGCSQLGIDDTGTNADDANTITARNGNDAAWAVSAFLVTRPMIANNHESEYANASVMPIAPRKPHAFVWMRQPTMKPTIDMSTITNALRTKSASVRPTSTALRAIGNERNRLMRPFWRSSARPTPVLRAPNTIVWMKTPGIRKSTYGTPPGTLLPMAPPNTYTNMTTKMIGWMVANTTSSGVRRRFTRLRHAMVIASFTGRAPDAAVRSGATGSEGAVIAVIGSSVAAAVRPRPRRRRRRRPRGAP